MDGHRTVSVWVKFYLTVELKILSYGSLFCITQKPNIPTNDHQDRFFHLHLTGMKDFNITVINQLKDLKKTRVGVSKTLCPQHMLVPKDSLEMIPNLDGVHNGKGPWPGIKTNKGPVTHGPCILSWAPEYWEKMPKYLMFNNHFWQSGPLNQMVNLYPYMTLPKFTDCIQKLIRYSTHHPKQVYQTPRSKVKFK